MVDIEKVTLGQIFGAGKGVGDVVDVRLAEQHFTQPQPITCPRCGSSETMKYGTTRDGTQEYLCSKCKRKFTVRDLPYGMRTPVGQIGASLTMYYNGLSLRDVAQYLNQTHNNPVDHTNVYRWLIRFTKEAIALFEPIHPIEPIHPKVGSVWIADETVIKFNDINHWVFDCIDRDTRFLLASYLSRNRGTEQARILMELASNRAGGKAPSKVITDKLASYIDGIELTFGADTKHIQSTPFTDKDSTNIIERFQGTIKERTKVLRGFKTPETAKLILAGFLIHYNYFRPHIGLKDLPPKGVDKTPAEVAGVKAPVKNWTELVRKVSVGDIVDRLFEKPER